MEKVKTFEEFINKNYIKESSPISDKVYGSNIISQQLQDEIDQNAKRFIKEGLAYHNDNDDTHTLKEALSSYSGILGGSTSAAMNGSEFFNTLGLMSQNISQSGDYTQNESSSNDKYKKSKEVIKNYLDECHDEMIKSYTEKINEAKKSNEATAALIANKYKH